MDRALRVFISLWIGFAILVNVVAVMGIFIGADGFWAGMAQVREIYSPFNVVNYLAEVVLISPVIGAEAWLQKRRNRRVNRQPT